MNHAESARVRGRVVGALCQVVLACILTAGLWPFHVPTNAVSWLADQNGLWFGHHGAAVSAGKFDDFSNANNDGISLEIWLKPARIASSGGTILAFDSSPNPSAPFKLAQYGSGIAIQRYFIDEHFELHQFWFRVANVFEGDKEVFVTITSGKDHTDVYVNGTLAGRSTDPGMSAREVSGRLVLANSTVDDSWAGEIKGLALYRTELTSAQVSDSYQNWISDRRPFSADGQLMALYRFDERAGRTARNAVDARTDLVIPSRYFVLHKRVLNWDLPQAIETPGSWNLWRDVGLNIAGFVPVGFVFCAYFQSVKRVFFPALLVIAIGFLLSLTIELTQGLLPNRDSGISDIVTNTTGTMMGVAFYLFPPIRALWEKVVDSCLGISVGDTRG